MNLSESPGLKPWDLCACVELACLNRKWCGQRAVSQSGRVKVVFFFGRRSLCLERCIAAGGRTPNRVVGVLASRVRGPRLQTEVRTVRQAARGMGGAGECANTRTCGSHW